MHLYDDIEDASSSLRGSISSFIYNFKTKIYFSIDASVLFNQYVSFTYQEFNYFTLLL